MNLTSFFIAIPLLIATLSIFVDGLIPTATKAALGSQYFLPSKLSFIAVAVLLLAAISANRLISGVKLFKTQRYDLMRSWMWWLVMTTMSLVFVAYSHGFSAAFRSFSEYYFYLLLVPLFFNFRYFGRHFFVLLILISPILLTVAILQSFLNETIIDPGAPSDKFRVMAYIFDGTVRAFSLFGSSVNYGHYLTLLLSFTLARLFIYKNTWATIIFLAATPLLYVLIFLTYTRAVYLQAFSVTLFIFFARRHVGNGVLRLSDNKIILYFPVLVFMLYLMATLFAFFLGGDSGIGSGSTINERVLNWGGQIVSSYNEGHLAILFGRGVLQEDNDVYDLSVVIDNSFISIFANVGIVGLLGWILISWKIWRVLLNDADYNKSIFVPLGWYSTWVGISIVNNAHVIYSVLVLLFIGHLPKLTEKKSDRLQHT